MPIYQIKKEMPYPEFKEWKDKYEREPFGLKLEAQKHMQVCALLEANMYCFSGTKGKKLDPKKFLYSTTDAMIKEVIDAINRDDTAPWIDSTKDMAKLGLEFLQLASKKTGIPIK